jgi:hypothetical protein
MEYKSGEQAGHALGPPRPVHSPKTRCSRTAEKQEENVVEQHLPNFFFFLFC